MQLGAIIMSCFSALKQKGLRLTQPRRVILDYIHDKGEHLTADEIIKHVHGKFPHVNKSTIYRTLELLENNECVFKSESKGRTVYHHAEEGHHHHLLCRKCGKTIDCEEDIFGPIEKSLQDEFGFHTKFKHVVMKGICKECRSKSN